MKEFMDKAAVRAWKRRWKIVNDLTIREARAKTPAERLRELETLFAFAHSLDRPRDDAGIAKARRRWKHLQELTREG